MTIEAAAMQIVPALVSGDSIDAIARRRGLARTLRDVAALVRSKLVQLEESEDAAPTRVPPARVVAARKEPTRIVAPRRPARARPARVDRVRRGVETNTTPEVIEPPRLYAQLTRTAPYVPLTGVDADADERHEVKNAAPVGIEPPRLCAEAASTAPYVRRVLVEGDAPRRATLASWSGALARILRRPRRMHGRAPLFEPRYTYIRTQDPTLPG